MKINQLIQKAIDKIGDGTPATISWKQPNRPGLTYFLRFETETFKPFYGNSSFVQGWEIAVWLNSAGSTYRTIWRYDYFCKNCEILNRILNQETKND
jgi:hypothetical protein